jgi:hypothetical protein
MPQSREFLGKTVVLQNATTHSKSSLIRKFQVFTAIRGVEKVALLYLEVYFKITTQRILPTKAEWICFEMFIIGIGF